MRILLLSSLIILLQGCFPWKRIEYIEKPVYITKYRTIDNQYLSHCPMMAPPDKEEYKRSSCSQRIDQWIKVYVDQTNSTKLRNIKMEELIEINDYLSEKYNENIEDVSETK